MIALVVLALPVAAGLAVAALHALLYRDAARAAHAREDACPFDDPEEHTSTAVWTRLAVAETVATFALLLPLPSRGHDDAGRRSVVLVPEWGWPSWSMAPLARRLRRHGWNRVHQVGLGAWPSLDEGAHRLDAAFAALRRRHDVGDVDVIALGLGGLVVRRFLQRNAAHARVGRVMTLGTPHQGTAVAPWLRRGPWRVDVRPGAATIEELAGDAPALDAVAIASAHDVLLEPPDGAYWPGAFNVTLRDVGHFAQLFSSRVWGIVAENLAHEADGVRRRSHAG